MYERITNTLAALSVCGLLFIGCAGPAAIYQDEPEEGHPMKAPQISVTFNPPDFSPAFELKANKETAHELTAGALEIFQKIDTVESDAVTLQYVGAFYITMYAATAEQCGNDLGITASGRKVTDDPTCHTVAVDPAVIPLGSYLIIDGYPGIIFRADDTGSAINGYDIDIFTTDEAQSKTFNNQSGVKVWIIKD